MKVIESCPICGATTFKPFLHCKDYTVSHESFGIVQCSQCNFTLTNPVPTDEKIGDYYLSDAYVSHNRKATGLIDRIYLIARSFTLDWKQKILQKYTSPSTSKSILDYGCGTGEFITSCKRTGWRIFGVEPSDRAREQATQLSESPIAASLPEINISSVDVITLWHVLEHIPNLDPVLQQLKDKLSKDGTMFIAVPNHKSWDGQYYKEHWAGYDVPRHLWHFSQQNMKALLTKNNLKLIDTIPMKLDAFYISLLSEKYKSGNRPTVGGMIKAFLNGLRSNLAAQQEKEYSSLIYVVRK